MMGEIASIPPALHALAEVSSGRGVRVPVGLCGCTAAALRSAHQAERSHTVRSIPHVYRVSEGKQHLMVFGAKR